MVTLRSLGSCVASSWRMSRPWGGASWRAGKVFAVGGGVPSRKGRQPGSETGKEGSWFVGQGRYIN